MPSLADYDVMEKVGQGAQGSVYRSIKKSTGEILALKQIDVSCLTDKERLAVLAEVKVLATLAEEPHPLVMTYQESFVDDGSLWIALEWSANGSLQDVVTKVQQKKRPPLEEDEVWHYFLSLALALDHIHSMHILHRDVKMANVFLHNTEDQCYPRLQLGDFGVSTILDDRSRALTMVGTPYYLSPELCLGKAYSSKSDVWSLGVILYVLLNSKMPFEASNYAALILRIVQEEHAKHSQSSTKFSPTIKRMATWCMQKNEDNRPTARELLLHPECLKRAMKCGLPIPPAMLEEACYQAPPPKLAATKSATAEATQYVGASAPPLSSSSSTTVAPQDRPLPMKRLTPPMATVGKRRVRVVQGVSNTPPPPPAASAEPRRPLASSGSQRKPPSVGTVSGGGSGRPTQKVEESRPPVRGTSGSKSMKDVNAVRSLPRYGGEGSSDDEPQGAQQVAEERPKPSRLYTYEKQQLPRIQKLIAAKEECSSPGSGSSSGRYLDHIHKSVDEQRPSTRGGGVQNSQETIALLAKHDLAPPELLAQVDEVNMPPSSYGNRPSVPVPMSATVKVSPSEVPAWSPNPTMAGESTFHFAQHANVTNLNGSSTAAAGQRDTSLEETIEEEETAKNATVSSLRHANKRETHDEYEDTFEAEDVDEDFEDEDEETNAEYIIPPHSVTWKVDGQMGISAGPHCSPSRAPPPHTEEVPTVPGFDVSETPTEFLQNTGDVAQRAHELFNEGENLVGEGAFAEIIEVLTRDTPLSSKDLHEFIETRVRPRAVPGEPTAAIVSELMYLCFRYVMLEGEKEKLRRGE